MLGLIVLSRASGPTPGNRALGKSAVTRSAVHVVAPSSTRFECTKRRTLIQADGYQIPYSLV